LVLGGQEEFGRSGRRSARRAFEGSEVRREWDEEVVEGRKD
jgi:hypothetical protein